MNASYHRSTATTTAIAVMSAPFAALRRVCSASSLSSSKASLRVFGLACCLTVVMILYLYNVDINTVTSSTLSNQQQVTQQQQQQQQSDNSIIHTLATVDHPTQTAEQLKVLQTMLQSKLQIADSIHRSRNNVPLTLLYDVDASSEVEEWESDRTAKNTPTILSSPTTTTTSSSASASAASSVAAGAAGGAAATTPSTKTSPSSPSPSPSPSSSSSSVVQNTSTTSHLIRLHPGYTPTSALHPPPRWCLRCETRCPLILSSICSRAETVSVEDRKIKFRGLNSSLVKFFRGTDHLFLQDAFFILAEQHIKEEAERRLLEKEQLRKEGFNISTSTRPATNLPMQTISDEHAEMLSFREFTTQKTRIFISADAHVDNFGTYEDAQNNIVYGLNDFDPSLIGPYTLDLFRAATSLVIQSSANHLSQEGQTQILNQLATAYYQMMVALVGNKDEINKQTDAKFFLDSNGPVAKLLKKVKVKKNRKKMLQKFCYIDPTSGELRLNDEITSLDAVEPEIAAEIHAAWPDYLQSLNALHRGLMQQRAKQYIDAANTALKGEGTASSSSTHAAPEKVASVVSFEANHPPWSLLDEPWTQANVTIQEYFRIKSLANRIGAGMGSLGSRRLFALCEGPTKDPWDDILLDIKAEGEPAWWRYTSSTTVRLNREIFGTNHGMRVATAIHALSIHVDPGLGWIKLNDGSYSIRSRSPYKDELSLGSFDSVDELLSVATSLGQVLAISHARADNDYDPLVIPYSFEEEFLSAVTPAELPEFQRMLVQYGFESLQRRTSDFQCFVDSGLANNPNLCDELIKNGD